MPWPDPNELFLATKSHAEREDEEASRLVRPSTKKREKRKDLRRERMDSTPDADLDTKDKDTSMNFKDIGGSVVRRFLGAKPKKRKSKKPKPLPPLKKSPPKPEPEHKPGDVWESEKGDGFAAMNPGGKSKGGFKDEEAAKAYATGGAEKAPKDDAATKAKPEPRAEGELTPSQANAKKNGLPQNFSDEQQEKALSAKATALEGLQNGSIDLTPELVEQAQGADKMSNPETVGFLLAVTEAAKGLTSAYGSKDGLYGLVEDPHATKALSKEEKAKITQQAERQAKHLNEDELKAHVNEIKLDLTVMKNLRRNSERSSKAGSFLLDLLEKELDRKLTGKADGIRKEKRRQELGGSNARPSDGEDDDRSDEDKATDAFLKGEKETVELPRTSGLNRLRSYIERSEEFGDDEDKALAKKLKPLLDIGEGVKPRLTTDKSFQHDLKSALDELSPAQIQSFFNVSDYHKQLGDGLGLGEGASDDRLDRVRNEEIKKWIIEDLETEFELETVGMMVQHAQASAMLSNYPAPPTDPKELQKYEAERQKLEDESERLRSEVQKRKGWESSLEDDEISMKGEDDMEMKGGPEEEEAPKAKKPSIRQRLKNRKKKKVASMTTERRVVARYLGLPGPLAEDDSYKPGGFSGWTRAENFRLSDDDFKAILGSARDWLKTYPVRHDWTGSDLDLRMALDYAVWTARDGAYQAKIHPNTYEVLLGRLRSL